MRAYNHYEPEIELPSDPPAFYLPVKGIHLTKMMDKLESSLLYQALRRTGGCKAQAAILLGLNRTTLVEKLRKRGLVDKSPTRSPRTRRISHADIQTTLLERIGKK